MDRNARENTKTILFALGVIAVAIVVLALVFGWSNVAAAKTASGFVRRASVGNEFEIESSQLALQKSQNDMIKQFAQRMIDDHTKAGQDLTAVLASVPVKNTEASEPVLDRKHQNLLDKLGQSSGSDFDKLYVKDQVRAHDDAVNLFKNYAHDGDNEGLKNFASRTLPTLQSHQEEINQINMSL